MCSSDLIANAGDVNGDGFEDVIIGAVSSDVAGTNAGRAYVVFGSTGGYNNFDLSQLSVAGNGKGFIINGALSNAWYGYSASGAGDINGDGLTDLIVGSDNAYATTATLRPLESYGTVGGRSYVVFGRTGSGIVNLSGLSATTNTDGFMLSTPFASGWSV